MGGMYGGGVYTGSKRLCVNVWSCVLVVGYITPHITHHTLQNTLQFTHYIPQCTHHTSQFPHHQIPHHAVLAVLPAAVVVSPTRATVLHSLLLVFLMLSSYYVMMQPRDLRVIGCGVYMCVCVCERVCVCVCICVLLFVSVYIKHDQYQ